MNGIFELFLTLTLVAVVGFLVGYYLVGSTLNSGPSTEEIRKDAIKRSQAVLAGFPVRPERLSLHRQAVRLPDFGRPERNGRGQASRPAFCRSGIGSPASQSCTRCIN